MYFKCIKFDKTLDNSKLKIIITHNYILYDLPNIIIFVNFFYMIKNNERAKKCQTTMFIVIRKY